MNSPRKPICQWIANQISPDPLGSLDKIAELVDALPNLNGWTPKVDGMAVDRVLSLGAVLSRIDQHGCEPLLKRIDNSIEKHGEPSNDDFAELNAAAIMSLWSNSVSCVPTQAGIKTPDFKAIVMDGKVECEVTNSVQKVTQTELRERSDNLTQQLHKVISVAGLRVRFSDEADENDFRDLISAAASVGPGIVRESPNRWYIQGCETSIHPDPDAALPGWWPKQYAVPFMMGVSFEIGAQNMRTLTAIDVQWTLSTKSYINSLSKKEEAEQASGTVPFIVLCDVTHLPGAFGWYADNLPPILATWSKKISAVILFQRSLLGFDSLQIEYRTHVNPNALLLAPENIRHSTQGKLQIPFDSPSRSYSGHA